MVLLDTDIMIDLLRQHAPAVAWLTALSDEEIILPGFVVMELIQGCGSREEQEKVQKALATYAIQWPSAQACHEALDIFARYHLSHQIGMIDALIGALALSLGLVVHTFNQKHYTMIPGLNTVQPYRK